jgi:hypothetical protein
VSTSSVDAESISTTRGVSSDICGQPSILVKSMSEADTVMDRCSAVPVDIQRTPVLEGYGNVDDFERMR